MYGRQNMNYRKFGSTGLEVSALGFGCMRFPVIKEGDQEKIDEEKAIGMIRHAIDTGVNYIDTAYYYHNGESEPLVGKALQNGYREKTYLATKCPVWALKEEADFEKILDDQLAKLQTDHIDFYLLHALSKESFENGVKKLNLTAHMEKAREAGKIRYLGFSFHDSLETFKDIVDYYPWDFCQIQYNYVNTEYQAGREGLQYAASKGMGVVIMEPLLGGRLADPAPHHRDVFPKEKTPVEWTLDFLWDQKEVSLLLSGMSSPQQVEDNLTYAARSSAGMLTDEERQIFVKAKEIFDNMALVRCTKCAYCMPCPAGIDIPGTFAVYNKVATDGMNKAKEEYEQLKVKADACLRCRKCEHVCPQHIGISMLMTEIAEKFE